MSKLNYPMAMLAELTHRCPLSCPYCSNPLEMVARDGEMGADVWENVFRQAAAIGVLQLHVSGGEPASRRDLEEIVSSAREAGLYVNLITSGIGLTEARLKALVDAGVEHIQLSLQGVNAEIANRIGGYKNGYERKMDVAGWIKDQGIPLTLNAVMHKQNLATLPQTIDMAVDMGARRIEVATVQFHGWAAKNRAALMPSYDQSVEANKIVKAARERLKGQIVIDYVPADHHAKFPKACMGGWGSTGLVVAPNGNVMPCHAADTIPHLKFDNVQTRSLADIWAKSEAFNAYRGTDWMPDLCKSCDRAEIDWGGCRCQAMALAGDAGATDPVCSKSPFHANLVAEAEADGLASPPELIYRDRPG